MDEQALSYAEIKALCAGDPQIKEKMDLDIEVARLKVLKADHMSQHFRLEDRLLKYFPAEIEKSQEIIRGLIADTQTAASHPHPADGFAGVKIGDAVFTEKTDAGKTIIEACRNLKGDGPVPLGEYRGFSMELCFDAFSKEFEVILKGALSHKVTLGEDARGNLIRMDNALSGLSGRLERVQNGLMNLENQQNAAREELQKPFPQERELAEKSARLAELDAALNMDDSHSEAEQHFRGKGEETAICACRFKGQDGIFSDIETGNRKGGGCAVMEKKDQELHFFVTKSDQERIHQKMAEMGIRSKSAYLRKMALDGYCVKLDLQDVKELVSLLRRCSNNLNQYAKRANETGSIYQEDIRDLQARLDEIWQCARELLSRLASIR